MLLIYIFLCLFGECGSVDENNQESQERVRFYLTEVAGSTEPAKRVMLDISKPEGDKLRVRPKALAAKIKEGLEGLRGAFKLALSAPDTQESLAKFPKKALRSSAVTGLQSKLKESVEVIAGGGGQCYDPQTRPFTEQLVSRHLGVGGINLMDYEVAGRKVNFYAVWMYESAGLAKENNLYVIETGTSFLSPKESEDTFFSREMLYQLLIGFSFESKLENIWVYEAMNKAQDFVYVCNRLYRQNIPSFAPVNFVRDVKEVPCDDNSECAGWFHFNVEYQTVPTDLFDLQSKLSGMKDSVLPPRAADPPRSEGQYEVEKKDKPLSALKRVVVANERVEIASEGSVTLRHLLQHHVKHVYMKEEGESERKDITAWISAVWFPENLPLPECDMFIASYGLKFHSLLDAPLQSERQSTDSKNALIVLTMSIMRSRSPLGLSDGSDANAEKKAIKYQKVWLGISNYKKASEIDNFATREIITGLIRPDSRDYQTRAMPAYIPTAFVHADAIDASGNPTVLQENIAKYGLIHFQRPLFTEPVDDLLHQFALPEAFTGYVLFVEAAPILNKAK